MSALALMYRAMSAVAVGGMPQFTGDPYQAEDLDAGLAQAGIKINADGTIQKVVQGAPLAILGRWDGGVGSLTRSDYDFRADKVTGSGTLNGGYNQGVWYNGVSIIEFSISTADRRVWNGTVRVRPAGGGSDIDTAPLSIDVEAI